MSKVKYLYIILILTLLMRINYVCEGDIVTCQGIGEVGWANNEHTGAKESRLEEFRAKTVSLVRRDLPSPHSELLLGMALGIDRLYELPIFKKMLRDTSTIHVVVVSGYNVTLVYNTIIRTIGTPYKIKNTLLAIIGTLLFSMLSGFEPPVVRAWIMGSIIAFGKYYGRSLNALAVLLATGLILAIINPRYLYSISFQLSFLATLSLILFEKSVSYNIKKLIKVQNIFTEDLSATISAQVLIWPYLSYKFGQISLISPVVNALILWSVPLATMAGSLYLLLGAVSSSLGHFMAFLVYIPLDYFVFGIEHFSQYQQFILGVKVPMAFLIAYYLGLTYLYIKKLRLINA